MAVSTGIAPYELLNICYSMNKIPKEDKITLDFENKNQNDVNEVVNSLRTLLHEHGLLSNKLFDFLKDNILTQDILRKLIPLLK